MKKKNLAPTIAGMGLKYKVNFKVTYQDEI